MAEPDRANKKPSPEVDPQDLFSSALAYLDERMRRIERGFGLYSAKNKNPVKQLWDRMRHPGAMRTERKVLEADIKSIRIMLADVSQKMSREVEAPSLPVLAESSETPTGQIHFPNCCEAEKSSPCAPKKRLVFLGSPRAVVLQPGMTPQRFLAKCGRNTGNMMITHSLARELCYESAAFVGLHERSSFTTSEADLLVFPASNFLNPFYDFSLAVELLDRVQLPCLMVGLGAQSKGGGDVVRELPPTTRRFLEMVAERSETIGVRGNYTAELLARLGIHNVEVIGCPSFYANCQPRFPLRENSGKPLRKVAIHGSRQVVKLAFQPERMRAAEDALLRAALKYDAVFFTQNGLEETSLALDPQSLADWQMEALTSYYRDTAPDQVRQFFRTRNRIYGDIDLWRKDLEAFDFVVGTRFHGNIVALQAGVPAFLLVHDRRTLELAELLQLPHRRIDDPIFDLAKGETRARLDLEKLYEEADFGPTQRAYANLYPKYRALLDRSGVAHRLE